MKNVYYNFVEGDFAKYLGDMTIISGPLRNPSIGTILKIEQFNDKMRALFKPINSTQNIWIDFDKIIEIDTECKHLQAIGFVKVVIPGKKCKYIMNGITISGMTLSSIDRNGSSYHFITRLCIADFQSFSEEMIENFMENGTFNQTLFFEKFPSVYNLNRLVEELKIFGVNVDIKLLVQL